MLKHRLIVGPLLVAAVLVLAWLDDLLAGVALPESLAGLSESGKVPPGVIAFPVIAALSTLASLELAGILRRKSVRVSRLMFCLAAVLGLIVSCFVPTWTRTITSVAIVSTAAAVVMTASMLYAARHKSSEGVPAAVGGALVAFVYLGLMFGFLLAIRREYPIWVLVWVLLMPKACDIGAYFVGRAFGKHRLIPWLSPGKTWEGLMGGVAVAAVIGVAGAWILGNLWERSATPVATAEFLLGGLIAGAALGLIGQAGDLMASVFKRDAGVKDSGDTVPGFGGVLDVIDSPLLVAPAAYWALELGRFLSLP